MIRNMSNEFKHLSINERYKIKEMRDKGIGISEIEQRTSKDQKAL